MWHVCACTELMWSHRKWAGKKNSNKSIDLHLHLSIPTWPILAVCCSRNYLLETFVVLQLVPKWLPIQIDPAYNECINQIVNKKFHDFDTHTHTERGRCKISHLFSLHSSIYSWFPRRACQFTHVLLLLLSILVIVIITIANYHRRWFCSNYFRLQHIIVFDARGKFFPDEFHILRFNLFLFCFVLLEYISSGNKLNQLPKEKFRRSWTNESFRSEMLHFTDATMEFFFQTNWCCSK